MALKHTPVSRNLDNSVTFMGLEIEDLLILGLVCVGAMLVGQVFFSDRYLFFVPMNWALMLLVVAIAVPGLMVLKYGKPRGYLSDLLAWYSKPHAYSANEPDPVLAGDFILPDDDGDNNA
jgi:hypothetical protein